MLPYHVGFCQFVSFRAYEKTSCLIVLVLTTRRTKSRWCSQPLYSYRGDTVYVDVLIYKLYHFQRVVPTSFTHTRSLRRSPLHYYLMTFQATDDLQGYLRDAVLPRLKLMHKPETKLHQRYKSRRSALALHSQLRNLSNIIYLDSEFDGLVNECRLDV